MKHSDRLKRLIAAMAVLLTVFAGILPSEVYAAEWPQPSRELKGKSAILMEMDTGAILYSKEPDQKLYPASITKIMTGLLAVERLNMSDTITITAEMLDSIPSDAAIQGISVGEVITVKDCIYSLILRSSADMASALAYTIAGSEEAFAQLMTERAAQLGAVNTNFVNATGLHDDSHYTTARDMALITKAAVANPTFAEIFSTGEYDMAATNKEQAFTIWNRHNMLVKGRADYYQYATGGKTGYTDEAGRTLVTCAEKDGLKFIAVIMFSDNENIFADTRELFNYGFNNFKKITINGNEERFGQGGAAGFSIINKVYGEEASLLTIGEGRVVIPKDAGLSQTEYRLDMEIEDSGRGELARLQYLHEGNVLGETKIYMSSIYNGDFSGGSSLEKKEEAVKRQEVQEVFSINIFFILGIAAALLILVFVIRIIAKSVKRRRIGKKYYISK